LTAHFTGKNILGTGYQKLQMSGAGTYPPGLQFPPKKWECAEEEI